MDSDKLREISERDQLWASLRGLREEIERVAAGELNSTERQQHLIMLLARIVAAEIKYRDEQGEA
jgi:hypothetical protein